MDFGKLLHVAKKNSSEENEGRCYSTKFSPPKKETKDKSLSSGIKRFLAKRDEEEREKERQLRENRERLEAMRTNKSKNKINKMLKVIKSANKSVLSQEEGCDSGSAPPAGLQPDEDDYGYVSQESSAIYKKLMEKYKDTDESPQKAAGRNNNNNIVHKRPDPVSVAVKKDNNNKSRKPHPPSTTVSGKADNCRASSSGGSRPPLNRAAAVAPKPKPIRRAPPPVANFEALLKLAEKKQFEPIKVDQADSTSRKDERPMTQKEKREHEERQQMAEARRKRLESENYDYRRSTTNSGAAEITPASVIQKKEKTAPSAPQSSSLNGRPGTSRPSNSLSNQNAAGRPQQQQPRPLAAPTREQPRYTPSNSNRPQVAAAAAVPARTRPFPPDDVQQTRSFPPDDVRRSAPPQSRPFPPADVRRRPDGGARGGPGQSRDFKRPRLQEEEPEDDYYDSEEDDYDSEMDDFIDDGPLGQSDVSQCIKEIFGYDKSRYRDEVYDDREMESSFAQQMREESYSRKVGRLEDEADMKQEALDKARKAALKRSAKRS